MSNDLLGDNGHSSCEVTGTILKPGGLEGRVSQDDRAIEEILADLESFEALCFFRNTVQGHIDRFREFGTADADIKILIDGLIKINNKIARLYPNN